jgi:CheY-like chemotaxis protein
MPTNIEHFQSMNKRIFLIEDDEDDIFLFKSTLGEIDASFELEYANEGGEGLKKLKTMKRLPDVVFLDLNMPCMNGFEFMQTLKNDECLKDLPIVIFTSSNNPEDVEKTHQLGANVFLSKPVEYSLMKHKLKRVLAFDFSNQEPEAIVQYSV